MRRIFQHAPRGFTLVEVLLSIGIIAFCMGTILALLPTGLASQKNAQDQERAVAALNRAAAAAGSISFLNRDAAGKPIFQLPEYFTGTGSPATFTIGSTGWTCSFPLGEDGLPHQAGDPSPPRQTLYLSATAPMTEAEPLQVYAAIVWPSKPTDGAGTTLAQLKNRQGIVDAVIAYAPRY